MHKSQYSWSTCLVGESEDYAPIRDPTHVSDRGNAAVVGVVLRTQVLQLQDFCFPLQLRPNQHWYANVCKNINIIKRKKCRKLVDDKGQTAPKKGQRDEYVKRFNAVFNKSEKKKATEFKNIAVKSQ